MSYNSNTLSIISGIKDDVKELLTKNQLIQLNRILSGSTIVNNIKSGPVMNTLKFIKKPSIDNLNNLLDSYIEIKIFKIEKDIIKKTRDSINNYYKENEDPVFSESTIQLVILLYQLINKNNPMFTDKEIKIKGLATIYIMSIMLRYMFNLNVLPKEFNENFEKVGAFNEYKYPIYVDTRDGDNVNEGLVPNLWVKGRIIPYYNEKPLRTVEIEYSIIMSILNINDVLENIRVNIERGNKANDTYDKMIKQQKELEILQGKLRHDLNQDIWLRNLIYRRYPEISNINSEKTIDGVIIYPETIQFLNQLEEIQKMTLEERLSIFANHYNQNYIQVLSLGNSIASRIIDMKKIDKEVVMNLEEMTYTKPKKRIVISNNPVEVVEGEKIRLMSKIANESTEREERQIMNELMSKDKEIKDVIAQIEEEGEIEEEDTIPLEEKEEDSSISMSENPYLMIENNKITPMELEVNVMSSDRVIAGNRRVVKKYDFSEAIQKEIRRSNEERGKLVFKKVELREIHRVSTPTQIIFKKVEK
ncbi:Hypothetical protein EHI5A_102490 [Entamoeba histolytica KU27]|uniref:Uncharacterized protein n=2 Tax=Entamoeba histolytica TaxID=5759 RepID=M2R8U9_ENTHI|nr:Hypothetical protein EHI5A_102490 [Entamoeba histolytica KU27]